MSRSGYVDDYGPELNLYRGSVERSIRGRRGQKALRDLAQALDDMSVKELHANVFGDENGCMCTLGVLFQSRGIDPKTIPVTHCPDYGPGCDRDAVAKSLDVAKCFAAEVMYLNDEHWHHKETSHERWIRMRAWVAANLRGDEA